MVGSIATQTSTVDARGPREKAERCNPHQVKCLPSVRLRKKGGPVFKQLSQHTGNHMLSPLRPCLGGTRQTQKSPLGVSHGRIESTGNLGKCTLDGRSQSDNILTSIRPTIQNI